ncbi:hypothetical protein BH11PSE13_BH11PSE13_04380 [soil metagenome]
MMGMYWDATDALKSRARGNYKLSAAQAASAAGAAFTITAAYAAIAALSAETTWMISAATWATIGCVMGLVGAILLIGAALAIWVLSIPQWKEWLQDIPLNKQNKGKKPRFENLKETQQKLANAIESLGFAVEPVGAPA